MSHPAVETIHGGQEWGPFRYTVCVVVFCSFSLCLSLVLGRCGDSGVLTGGLCHRCESQSQWGGVEGQTRKREKLEQKCRLTAETA